MGTGHILGISGSLRAGSLNTRLLAEAERLFDPARITRAADAVIISGPEYNKSISGVLKNALDWVSRTKPNPWRDKPVALMSATAGRAGGERAQWIMRLALNPFRPRLLVGPEVLVGSAASQFDEAGRLINDRYLAALTELMAALRTEAGLAG